MNFTFGIVTLYENLEQIKEVVSSIRNLRIKNYEILIIGDGTNESDFKESVDLKKIKFDETVKQGWITRKKNVLVDSAKYDNVVVMHDYYLFDNFWYKNFLEFGDDWDVCSNAQLLINNKRHFTDWVIWDSPIFPRYSAIPYHDWSQTRCMYQSGGYMIVKKDFYKKFPMNEDMTWGSAEDVEWSLRMRTSANWKCNGKSIVKHNKVHRDAK
jgi:hypothetical protein